MSSEILTAEAKHIIKLMFKPRNAFSFELSDGEITQDLNFSHGLANYINKVDSIVRNNEVDLSIDPYTSVDKASDGSAYMVYSFAPFVRFGHSPFILIEDNEGETVGAFINLKQITKVYCNKAIRAAIDNLVLESMKGDCPISYDQAKEDISENLFTRKNSDNIPKIEKSKNIVFFIDFKNNVLWSNNPNSASMETRRMLVMLRNYAMNFSSEGFDGAKHLVELRDGLFEGENINLTSYPSYSTGKLKTVGAFNLHKTIEFFSVNEDAKGIELTNTAKLKSRSISTSSVTFNDSINNFIKEDPSIAGEHNAYFTNLFSFAEEKGMDIKELKVQGELLLPQDAIEYMSEHASTALSESGLSNLIDVEFKLNDTKGQIRVELTKTLQMKVLIKLLIDAVGNHFNDEVMSPAKAETALNHVMACLGQLFLEKSRLFISTFHITNAVTENFGEMSTKFEIGSDSDKSKSEAGVETEDKAA